MAQRAKMSTHSHETNRRDEHCTHPGQTWCDCDWCRCLRHETKRSVATLQDLAANEARAILAETEPSPAKSERDMCALMLFDGAFGSDGFWPSYVLPAARRAFAESLASFCQE